MIPLRKKKIGVRTVMISQKSSLRDMGIVISTTLSIFVIVSGPTLDVLVRNANLEEQISKWLEESK